MAGKDVNQTPAKAGISTGKLDEPSPAGTRLVLNRWRRGLTLALGGVWLLDALLQYQPYMFTSAFPTQTIQPSGQGSPIWVSGPVDWAANLMSTNLIVWNALFATTQLAIALGIFWPKTRKIALVGSIAWALGVWWMGEGMGGTFAGPMSPWMGLPGGALLYAVIAVLVWPSESDIDESVAAASPMRADGSKLVWLVLWMGFAVETVIPANASGDSLSQAIITMNDGEPGWVQWINNTLASAVGDNGWPVCVIAAIGFAFAAIGIFYRALTKAALVVAIVLSLVIWIAEDFGGIFSGSGTDPNTGPLLILLALCFWPLGAPVYKSRGNHDVHCHEKDLLDPASKGELR